MVVRYLELNNLSNTCPAVELSTFKEWAFRLDQGLGNADGVLQQAELIHFIDYYLKVPGFQHSTYWQWVAAQFYQWGKPNGALTPQDGADLVGRCFQSEVDVAKVDFSKVPLRFDPERTTLEPKLIDEVWQKTGRLMQVQEWASLFPNAKLRGVGETLSALAQHPEAYVREAFVSRNGDLDITHLSLGLLNQWVPEFILRQDDDFPTSFQFFSAHSQLKIPVGNIPAKFQDLLVNLIDPAYKPGSKFIQINLSDSNLLKNLLSHPQLQGLFYPFVRKFNDASITQEEKQRLAIVMALDFPGAELVFDDKIINDTEWIKKHAQSYLHGSVRVHPLHLEDRIFIYTPLYVRSLPPQGKYGEEVTRRPARGYSHQADSESAYLILDQKGELQHVFGDTHYYLFKADQTDVYQCNKNKRVTFSVSYLAHGNQLAQEKTALIDAKTGSLRGGTLNFLQDVFPGWEEVESGKSVLLKPQVLPDVVGLTQINVQIGKTIGMTNFGFNDGIRFRRLRTDFWEYNTQALYDFLQREITGLLDRDLQVGLGYGYSLAGIHQLELFLQLANPKREGLMFNGGIGVTLGLRYDAVPVEWAMSWEATLAYGVGAYIPEVGVGLEVPVLFFGNEQDPWGLGMGISLLLYPVSFQVRDLSLHSGGKVRVNTPNFLDTSNYGAQGKGLVEFIPELQLHYSF